MNHARTAIAATALALSAAALGATHASANHPAENGTLPDAVAPHDPPPPRTIEVPVDDTVGEGIQSGASVLGGAGAALTGVWIYRRRHTLNN